jgi:hypothetical protein
MKSNPIRLFAAVVVCLAASAFIFMQFGSREPIKLVAPPNPIPAEFFGLHIHRAAKTTPWPSVPFGSWRLWDAMCHWSQMELEKGQWHWEILDREVDLAEKHHVDLLMTMGDTPAWASARPNEGRRGRFQEKGGAAEPKDMQDWRNYVRALATRYRGRIHYYEIWNEPNLENFFSGTPEKMLELAREAYTTLKQVDPTIQVVSPSAVGPTGLTWLEEYLQLGGGKYADIIGYHFYVHRRPPEDMLRFIQPVKEIMQKGGVSDKPLWNTESGWIRGPQPQPINLETQAPGWAARAYFINWASGVQRFYWYAWDDDGGDSVPFTQEDQATATSSAHAYAEIQKWLIGSRMDTCENTGDGNWICKLTRESGRPAWILWNESRDAKFEVPKSWAVKTVTKLSGEQFAFNGDKIGFSELPVLLEGQARN